MIAQSGRDGRTGPHLLGQEKPFRVLKEVSETGAELGLESPVRGRPEPLRAKMTKLVRILPGHGEKCA